MKLKTIIALCFTSILCGCVKNINSSKLESISVDMDKAQIVNKIGNPSVVRGSIKNNYGQIIEVWEYRVNKGKSGEQLGLELAVTAVTFGICAPILLSEGEVDAYWLYFCDGNLVKWGQAGDWSREADVIQEIRFNSSPLLH